MISANYQIDNGTAQAEKIDNVYVFVNSHPVKEYDVAFEFDFTPIGYTQSRPMSNYYRNVVKAAYRKDEGKSFDGILFNDVGKHKAIKFK